MRHACASLRVDRIFVQLLELLRSGCSWCAVLLRVAFQTLLYSCCILATPCAAAGQHHPASHAQGRLPHTASTATLLVSFVGFSRRRRQYALANAYAQDGSVAYLRGQTQISRPPPPGLRRPRLVRDVSQQVGLLWWGRLFVWSLRECI